jgi:hypothetical protein
MAQQQDLATRPLALTCPDLDLSTADDSPVQPDVQQQLDTVATLHSINVTYLGMV